MSPLAARDPNEDDEAVESTQAGQLGPGLLGIDHVGIAVRDLPAALDAYREAYDAVVEHREVDDSEGVEEALLAAGDGWIRLMAPLHDHAPLADWLDEHGDGLHHVGYRVADCRATFDHLVAEGHEPVGDGPWAGPRGTTVARVRDPLGTLVELVETP